MTLQPMMEKAADEKLDRILLGNFNCNLLKCDRNAAKLEEIRVEYGLEQMIKCPTRMTETSQSMINLMCISTPDILKKVVCAEVALSDHELVYGTISRPMQRQKQKCFR